VYQLVDGIIRETNSTLPSYETIKKFAVLNQDFSQENGELTPTLKLKRKVVTEKNQAVLDSFYSEQY
jgi:long-chain acyl-CoA synthetase